jgi:hypothetical protein
LPTCWLISRKRATITATGRRPPAKGRQLRRPPKQGRKPPEGRLEFIFDVLPSKTQLVFDSYRPPPGLQVRFCRRDLQLCSPLLSFLPGKLALASFELDQFLLRRLKKAVAWCYCQLSVSRHYATRRLPRRPLYPSAGTWKRFGSEIFQRRLLCKHDNQPDSDQGAYAGNRYAETNSGVEVFRLDLDLLAMHCTLPTRCS